MDFRLSDETLEWRDYCRKFAREVIRPAAPKHDREESVPWEAIRAACREGMREFDFGRTDLGHEGLRSFKAAWGTDERALVHTTFGAAPASDESRLQSVLGATIRRSPAWVCRLLGESLYRYAA